MQEIDVALAKLNDFFEVTSFTYATFAKTLQKNPGLTRAQKDDLSNKASEKVVEAATPVINFMIKAQSATTQLQRELAALQAQISEDQEFTQLLEDELNRQIHDCQNALTAAKQECKPGKASDMPKNVKEAQQNTAQNLEVLQQKFNSMVRQFQLDAQQQQNEIATANARADEMARQLAQRNNSDDQATRTLTEQINTMQKANKELQQQIRQCQQDTAKIQQLESRAQEAEDEYGACGKEREELKISLKHLKERLGEMDKTSGEIASGRSLETVGEGPKSSFARAQPPRRGSGINKK